MYTYTHMSLFINRPHYCSFLSFLYLLPSCRGEFWLGNDHLHFLTKTKDMILRIELEDFEGVREYAKYDQFYVANEFLRYRLSVSGYRYDISFCVIEIKYIYKG